MENIRAAIFDLDGVIVDTAKYHFLAWKRLAEELDINFTLEDNERLKGVSRMRSLEIILEIGGKTYDQDFKEKLAASKNTWYKEYIEKMDESELLEGAKEFIETLKNNGIKVALGSASKNAMMILTKLNILNYFDAIIDGTKVKNAKPDPEVFLLGAEAVGAKPEDCIVFEDAEAGIEAAKRAGMIAIGIGKSDTLKDSDLQIDGLHEMDLEKFNLLFK
ncbi:beta-phosphoglucomutase [Wukongibacter baidiensis]|uniref:beta-phosphoglucomutase n=1 Tax=Wukongibacter baidiensis TaxID=1723361 RepID=UPI003D7F4289